MPRRRRGARAVAVDAEAERGLAMRILLHSPKDLVAGVLAGSFVTSLATSRFKWDGYTSPSHMIRSIGGAVLMGSGGAMALGCSVGQGLTGVSTLALASFLAITGIVVGAAVGLRGPLQVRALASA